MIFGELRYQQHYDEMHQELVEFIKERFPNVESGHQGDSWIWVLEESDKVQIDTFSSMCHQIKSPYSNSKLVHEVIHQLKSKYQVSVFDEPELEAHED